MSEESFKYVGSPEVLGCFRVLENPLGFELCFTRGCRGLEKCLAAGGCSLHLHGLHGPGLAQLEVNTEVKLARGDCVQVQSLITPGSPTAVSWS